MDRTGLELGSIKSEKVRTGVGGQPVHPRGTIHQGAAYVVPHGSATFAGAAGGSTSRKASVPSSRIGVHHPR
jgi:hypothetical protein